MQKEKKGKFIVVYVGKGPWMLMDSKKLAMCSYYPYGNHGAAIYYQLDPRVVEISFVVVDKVPEKVDWKFIEKIRDKEYCMLCYLALDKEGRRVLIVDEANGILDFAKENIWYLKRVLYKVAKELNVDLYNSL